MVASIAGRRLAKVIERSPETTEQAELKSVPTDDELRGDSVRCEVLVGNISVPALLIARRYRTRKARADLIKFESDVEDGYVGILDYLEGSTITVVPVFQAMVVTGGISQLGGDRRMTGTTSCYEHDMSDGTCHHFKPRDVKLPDPRCREHSAPLTFQAECTDPVA